MKNVQNKKGFTLIESLIAIAILMIAIAGPLSISEKSLSTSYNSRDQMTATFLAEEAFESVKNIRDQVKLRNLLGDDWLQPFVAKDCICSLAENNCDLNIANAKYCNIDATKPDMLNGGILSPTSDGAATNPLKIKKDGENFVAYDLQSADSSKFSRLINIYRTLDNLNEALVSVKVLWQSSTGPQNVYLKSYIYNI